MKKRSALKALLVMGLVCGSVAFAADAGMTFKGNPDSKIYHKPGCQYYASKGSSVAFKSDAEAKQAGYTLCKKCAKPKTKETNKASEKK